MISTTPFLSLTAADLMHRDVVTVSQEMSLRAAARLLSHNEIGGAPVVDANGRCIGVLSATDFVHWAAKGERSAEKVPCGCNWQVVGELDNLPADRVTNFMTRDPVTVRPNTPIGELARAMIDAHIHRVIVVDEGVRPIGIVSATNVLAAVAQADFVSLTKWKRRPVPS